MVELVEIASYQIIKTKLVKVLEKIVCGMILQWQVDELAKDKIPIQNIDVLSLGQSSLKAALAYINLGKRLQLTHCGIKSFTYM